MNAPIERDDLPTPTDLALNGLADAHASGDYSRYACRECGYVPRDRAEADGRECPQCGYDGRPR
jgi:rubrerythrin